MAKPPDPRIPDPPDWRSVPPDPEERLSHALWRARFALEARLRPDDPSWVFVGDLANALEEHDVHSLGELVERLSA